MFTEIFNELLEEKQINRKQFAEQSGIPYTTVVGWTNTGRLPDFNALVKIADFFQCSVDYITGRQKNVEGSVFYSAEISPQGRTLLNGFNKLDQQDKELVLKLTKRLNKK